MLEEEKTKKIYVRGRGKGAKTKKKEKGNHVTSPTHSVKKNSPLRKKN
jgi:hypothetical protein